MNGKVISSRIIIKVFPEPFGADSLPDDEINGIVKEKEPLKSALSPIGTVQMNYLFNINEGIPIGWMECRGQALLVKGFPDLFEVIGYSYSPQQPFNERRARWWERLIGRGRVIRTKNPSHNPLVFHLPEMREPWQVEADREI